MNEDIMRKMGFGKEMDRIKYGRCPFCGDEIHPDYFRDSLSKREWEISGLCQKCQDKTFGGPGDGEGKTFEVKIAYQGYQVFRVQAKDEDEAYQKAEKDAGVGLFEDVDHNIQTSFLGTINRVPEEDEVNEVDLESPVDEDLVTFGPTTFPGGPGRSDP